MQHQSNLIGEIQIPRPVLRSSRLPCAILLLLLLDGCNQMAIYAPPPVTATVQNAAIVGSIIREPGPLNSDILILPNYIDGKYCGSEWYNDISSRWDKPFSVSPGRHQIKILVSIGGTFGSSAFGFASIEGNFEPGKIYTIKGTDPLKQQKTLQSEVWIEDDSGAPKTARFIAVLGSAVNVEVPIFISK